MDGSGEYRFVFALWLASAIILRQSNTISSLVGEKD